MESQLRDKKIIKLWFNQNTVQNFPSFTYNHHKTVQVRYQGYHLKELQNALFEEEYLRRQEVKTKKKKSLDELKPLAPTTTVNTKHSPTSIRTEINPHTNSLCKPVSNTQYKMLIFQEKNSKHEKCKKKNLRRQNNTITRPRYDTDDRTLSLKWLSSV